MFQKVIKYMRRKSDPIELLQRLAPRGIPLKTLVHVGAHLAQEREHYERYGYKKILWIEGSERVHNELAELIRHHHGPAEHSTRCAVLTNQDGGEVALRGYSNNGMSSSIFPVTENHINRWPDVKETGKVEHARSMTLDSLLASTPFSNNLDVLVVDVQGAELLVLQGAVKTLSGVKAVVSEVSTKPYYQGGVLFDELNQFLESHGFAAMSAPRRHGDTLFLRTDLNAQRAA